MPTQPPVLFRLARAIRPALVGQPLISEMVIGLALLLLIFMFQPRSVAQALLAAVAAGVAALLWYCAHWAGTAMYLERFPVAVSILRPRTRTLQISSLRPRMPDTPDPALLTRIAQLVGASGEPGIMPVLAEEGCKLTGAQLALIGSYTPATGDMLIRAVYGSASEGWLGWRYYWPGLSSVILECDSALTDPRLAPLHVLLRQNQLDAVVLVPLQSQQHVVGILLLAGKRGALSPAASSLAQLLAGPATSALSHAQLREQASQAAQARAVILDTISHEFRTPITVVLGFTELYQEGVLGEVAEEQREALDAIHRNARRLLKLVEGLLDLAGIEAGEIELSPAAIHMELCLHEALVQLQLDPTQIYITGADALPRVWADANWLRRALVGLLTFALETTHSHPLSINLVVGSALAPGELMMELPLPGMDFEAGNAAALFDMMQVPGVDRAGGGALARLGLELSRRVLELLGGRVMLEQRSTGACLMMVLRCAECAYEAGV